MTTEEVVECFDRMEQEILELGLESDWIPEQAIFIAHLLGQNVSVLNIVRAMLLGGDALKEVSDPRDRAYRILEAIRLSKEV